MTSEMQRDIERIEPLIPFDPETREAWQRIRQRLSPDREWLTDALQDTAIGQAKNLDHYDARRIVDAVINAMGEP